MALINLRNALMGGKRLPYDAEVEFLDCDASIGGRAYIELPNSALQNDTQIVAGFEILKAPAWGGAFTMYEDESHAWIRVICYNGSMNTFLANTLTAAGNARVSSTRDRFDCMLAGSYVVLNGTRTNLTAYSRPRPSAPMRIGPTDLTTQARIYYFKVISGLGETIYDLIPVRKGTVGYLYDRVSGALFGNAGTGDFVLGPDKN